MAGSLAVCKKHSEGAHWFVSICLPSDYSIRLGRPAKDEESVECEFEDCSTIASHRVLWKKRGER